MFMIYATDHMITQTGFSVFLLFASCCVIKSRYWRHSHNNKVNYRFPFAGPWVDSQVNSYEIQGGRSGTEVDFSLAIFGFTPIIIIPLLLHTPSITIQ
jgi:hypothetical protein